MKLIILFVLLLAAQVSSAFAPVMPLRRVSRMPMRMVDEGSVSYAMGCVTGLCFPYLLIVTMHLMNSLMTRACDRMDELVHKKSQ